jgi:serine/threonine protein kinase
MGPLSVVYTPPSTMKACPSCGTNHPSNYTHCPRDGTPLIEIHAWQEGTVVRGKYRILGKIGEGGMAVVYKAVHTRFDELRALKVMSPELAGDQAFVKRFMHEAVLTRKLHHANAVRVEDIDEAEDGRPFIVMEYIEGRSLKEVIQAEAPMGAERVCSISAQVAKALDAAHRLGIVHRDIKPANIFLVAENRSFGEPEVAKVLDFGIAKVKEAGFDDGAASHHTLTGTGSVIGTPAYMSPEQARGLRGDQLDGRSDVYSLGVVMYEMLIRELPLHADTSVQWILAHAQTPPKPLWEARPDLPIPPAVAAVVMRCLEKDPQNRPDSALQLAAEIQRAQQQFWSPSATRVFPPAASAAGSSAVRGQSVQLDLAAPFLRASEARATVSEVQQARARLRASRVRIAWLGLVAAAVLVAGGMLFWNIERPTKLPSVAPLNPASAQTGGSPSSPVPVLTNAAPSSSPATPPSEPAGSEATSVPAQPAPAHKSSQKGSAETVAPSETPKAAVSGFKAQAEAAAKNRLLSTVLLRARNDENEGRFEDALKDYEEASRLDPSDATLERHIRLLQQRISNENQLIH